MFNSWICLWILYDPKMVHPTLSVNICGSVRNICLFCKHLFAGSLIKGYMFP